MPQNYRKTKCESKIVKYDGFVLWNFRGVVIVNQVSVREGCLA